nr:glycosyltransferase [uncultured Blautia sp.]
MKLPIRVLQVIGIMNRGGAENMIMNLYRNINRDKIQFDFVEHTDEEAAFDSEILDLGGAIYHCPKYQGLNHFVYVNWWKRFFNKYKGAYAIVHAHIGSTASIYLNIAKKYGIYVIAHSHNINELLHIKSFVYQLYSFRTRYIADYFFGCSKVAGRDRFGTKVSSDSSRFSVLNNAIDVSAFRYDFAIRESVRKDLGIENNAFVIGHVGRFEEQKNHCFLLNVFESVLKKNNDAILLLVGDGVLREQIQNEINRRKIDNRVILTGIRTDVNRLMQAMDIFVFPSLYEGLPVAIVEAQASGLPCVISNRVPQECIIIPNMVFIMDLDDTYDNWANIILIPRKRQESQQVITKGFDIKTTSVWLERFYLKIACKS